MIPKSTAKLQSGDFCWIQREDDRFVPFVYICKQAGSRSYFYGGIIDCITEQGKMDELGSNLNITEHALLHIKCFRENNTPITGNLHRLMLPNTLESLSKTFNSTGVGSKTNVWGYKTIYKYANSLKA